MDVKKLHYPQPDTARAEWLNLNGAWEFSFDAPLYDKTIEVPYPWGSPLSGIDESKNAAGYYRRSVRWNPENSRIFLCFGAVDYTCEVTVNGSVLVSHKGGYSRFEFEVTNVWNRTGGNEILVTAVDTGDQSVQTYGKQGYGNARGIWQTVWLEARPDAFIRSFIVNTKLDGTVSYEIETENAQDGTAVSAVFGENHAEGTVEGGHASLSFTVVEPKLWTPEEPNLYDGTLTLCGEKKDTVETYFGIREIGTGVFGEHGHRYITLNGKPYYLNGVLDQSFNPKGFFTLPGDDDCREEILRLKRIGVNMARIHIKAEEPLKLYWADRLGLLIMEDVPCFWGDPTEDVRRQFEIEMEDEIVRDRNHPAVFYWVIFNETWGLFSHFRDAEGKDAREYTMDTAEWVVSCVRRAKALDPTRLVEDNSVCNQDHTVTDVNTWHFYSNGYERVKGVVDGFCRGAYVGSEKNYHKGYAMEDVPCMNSECGNVWGIRGNAGMSDISWQYKYMMNEFRLHDKLCGFVFTEFHDVINEFNGYYKIDNSDKDFGYSAYGMSLRDLHSQDYLGTDCAPMTTVRAGSEVTVPLFGSSFTDRRHGRVLDIEWELTASDALGGENVLCDNGSHSVVWSGYGMFPAGAIRTVMPDIDGPAVLSWTLYDGDDIVMRNCVFFDVEAPRGGVLSVEPADMTAEGFSRDILAMQGKKRSGLGSGSFSCKINTSDIPGFADAADLRVVFEASTRAPMTHDDPTAPGNRTDSDYMLGYRCDAGANPNSFPQTDADVTPGSVVVSVDGVPCGTFLLPDCPADSRGLLSHHYQPVDDLLDEAGTYGYLCDLTLPSAVLLKIKEKESFVLSFSTDSGAGLSLFGRKSGRYGTAVSLLAQA